MTKEEYYEILINSDKPSYYIKYLELDDEESEKLSTELKESVPFNTMIPAVENSVLESALSGIDDTILANALKYATKQTNEKIFSVLSVARSKEIKEKIDFIGPQLFKRIIENQEKIVERIKAVSLGHR